VDRMSLGDHSRGDHFRGDESGRAAIGSDPFITSEDRL
jgi:hypothetical protein